MANQKCEGRAVEKIPTEDWWGDYEQTDGDDNKDLKVSNKTLEIIIYLGLIDIQLS